MQDLGLYPFFEWILCGNLLVGLGNRTHNLQISKEIWWEGKSCQSQTSAELLHNLSLTKNSWMLATPRRRWWTSSFIDVLMPAASLLCWLRWKLGLHKENEFLLDFGGFWTNACFIIFWNLVRTMKSFCNGKGPTAISRQNGFSREGGTGRGNKKDKLDFLCLGKLAVSLFNEEYN